MDYTDGSREFKFLQELLHLLEAAMTKSHGMLQGNLPDVVMKEMKKKGFQGNDFQCLQVDTDYHDQYHRALVARNVPYLGMQSVHGKQLIVVRDEDVPTLLDIDASIRKGSSKYTRTEQINAFVKSQKKLGNEVFCIPMTSEITHQILANKSFDHEAGFVTSYSSGHCFFSETAVDSAITTIFVDAAISCEENTHIGRIKKMNNYHERLNETAIETALASGETAYFVNEYDNSANYIKVTQGQLEVHTKNGLLDEVITRIDAQAYFKEDKKEALKHAISKELGEIYNCEQMSETEFSEYRLKSAGQLDALRKENLLEDAKILTDLESDPTPSSLSTYFPYLSTDDKSLYEMEGLLHQKVMTAKTPELQEAYRQQFASIKNLRTLKTSHRDFLKYLNKQVDIACKVSLTYDHLSAKDKLEFQMKEAIRIMNFDTTPEVSNFFENSGLSRTEFTEHFTQTFGAIHTYEEFSQAQQSAYSASAIPTPSPAPISH